MENPKERGDQGEGEGAPVPNWKKNKRSWFKIGIFSFISYSILIGTVTVIYGLYISMKKPGFIEPKDLLWMSQPLGLFLFLLETIGDHFRFRMTIEESVVYNKRFVAYGNDYDVVARRYLYVNLGWLITHTTVTTGLSLFYQINTFNFLALLFVNILAIALQVILRVAYSNYYDLTSDVQLMQAVEKEEKRRLTIGHWTSNRLLYLDLGCFFRYLYIAWIFLLGFVLDMKLVSATLAKDKTFFCKNLVEILTIFGIVFFLVERGLGVNMAVSETVLIKKRYVAFGKNPNKISRLFLLINLLYCVTLMGIALLSLNNGYIDEHQCRLLLIDQVAFGLMHLIIRLSFSKYYALTGQQTINKLKEKVEKRIKDKKEKREKNALLLVGDGEQKDAEETEMNPDVENGADAAADDQNEADETPPAPIFWT